MNNFLVLKVRDKKTKQEIWIKDHMFNKSYHTKIDGVNPIAFSQYQSLIEEQKPSIIVPKRLLKKKVEKEEEKEDNGDNNSEGVEVPKNMFAARKWASEHGMKVTPKTTKQEIKAWASTNLT
jgi:hypothetical protein